MAATLITSSEYFTKGAKVEISSNEHGLSGLSCSWYEGTVTSLSNDNKRSSKVLVEYDTLRDAHDQTLPLRKAVDFSKLRPPPMVEDRGSFRLGEEVDAYYHEGWWEGLIFEILENNRYLVLFRGTRDEIAFKASDLRIHHEWIRGKWFVPFQYGVHQNQNQNQNQVEVLSAAVMIPMKQNTELTFSLEMNSKKQKREHICSTGKNPKKQKREHICSPEMNSEKQKSEHICSPEENQNNQKDEQTLSPEISLKNHKTKHSFKPGEAVEVSSDEEGLEGAWFCATVIIKLEETDKYLIEYQSLNSNEDDTKLLREEVDSLHLRPCPPYVEQVDRYEVYEKVEALYNDAWWAGVVSKVLKEDRYYVYFESSDEELMFKDSKLRVHQEWINGKWITPSKAAKL